MLTKTDTITELLATRIRKKQMAPGSRLPTAEALASEFDISKGTARAVVDRLIGQKLICKRGNSWYVARR